MTPFRIGAATRTAIQAACAASLALAMGCTAMAQEHDPQTTPGVAAKVALRGSAQGITITEFRAVRRNDILSVQGDLANTGRGDRTVFYRFRWVDSVGNQVGDGESWKQMTILGKGRQTIKSVAPHGSAVDFQLEMNVES